MEPPAQIRDSERRQVEAMAGYGVSEADIARVLGIDPETLRERYRDELDTGHVVANATVAESLFRKATGDHRQSVTAAIFWLKTRAGWRETSPSDPDPAVEFPTRIIITGVPRRADDSPGARPLSAFSRSEPAREPRRA